MYDIKLKYKMAKLKPIENPEYTKLVYLVLKGKNTPKQMLNSKEKKEHETKLSKTYHNLSNLSMKLQNLRTLGFLENVRLRSINNSSTSKYEVNFKGLLIGAYNNILQINYDQYLEDLKELLQSTGEYDKEKFNQIHTPIINELERYIKAIPFEIIKKVSILEILETFIREIGFEWNISIKKEHPLYGFGFICRKYLELKEKSPLNQVLAKTLFNYEAVQPVKD